MKRLGPWLTLTAGRTRPRPTGHHYVQRHRTISREYERGGHDHPAPTQTPPTTTAAVPFPAEAESVGTIPLACGVTITLEITVAGDKAIAYACDDKSIESRLRGPATTGSLQLTGRNDIELTGARGALVIKMPLLARRGRPAGSFRSRLAWYSPV